MSKKSDKIVEQLRKFLGDDMRIDFQFDTDTAQIFLVRQDEFVKLLEMLDAPKSK